MSRRRKRPGRHRWVAASLALLMLCAFGTQPNAVAQSISEHSPAAAGVTGSPGSSPQTRRWTPSRPSSKLRTPSPWHRNLAAGVIPNGQTIGAWATGGAAAGASAPAYPGAASVSAGGHKAIALGSGQATSNQPNHSTINGTGLKRPGSGTGTIGGPARRTTGINGTALGGRH